MDFVQKFFAVNSFDFTGNEKSKIAGHDAVCDGLHASIFQSIGIIDECLDAVKYTALPEGTGPCKDGGYRVGRGLFPVAVAVIRAET